MARSKSSAAARGKPTIKASSVSKYSAWPDVSETRRRTMSAIRSRDTQPEMIVRRLLHSEGYRYFVSKRLEGFRPDLIFARRRKAIFVHGCFWHGHPKCGHDKVPKTRTDYWRKKIQGNRLRDKRALTALERSGWGVMVLWECEISRSAGFLPDVVDFLGPPRWTNSGGAGAQIKVSRKPPKINIADTLSADAPGRDDPASARSVSACLQPCDRLEPAAGLRMLQRFMLTVNFSNPIS